MISRRSLLGGLLAMGMPIRPDQVFNPPPPAIAPGSSAGIFRGKLVIVFGTGFSGVFVYSPTPGAGNLVASVAASAGSDSFGNSYVAGIAVYGAAGQTIQLEESAGTALLNFLSGASSESKPAQITETISGSGASGQVFFRIFGPQSTATSNDRVEFFMFDSPPASPGTAGLFVDYITGATAVVCETVDAAGWSSPVVQFITAAQPGTSGATLTAETWHTLPLNSPGFVAGATLPRYRFEPMGVGGVVRLVGQVKLGANQVAGATIATLPAGYVPSVQHPFLTLSNLSGATGSVTAALGGSINVTSGGAVNLVPSGTNGNVVWLDGITFPLD